MASSDVGAGSGFCPETGVYSSPWQPCPLPISPTITFPDYLFSLPIPPESPTFIDASTGDSLSFAALRFLSTSAAAALHAAGLRPGDVALLVSRNSIHYPALSLAVMSIGAVLSVANPISTRLEIHAQALDSRPSVLIVAADLREKLGGLVEGRPMIVVDDLVAAAARSPPPPPPPPQIWRDSAAAALMYSSGTTGRSKAVVCTHGNLIAMAHVLRHVWGSPSPATSPATSPAATSPAARYLCVVPMSHMFGFSVFVCGAPAAGASVAVMRRRYSAEEVLAAVEENRVERLPAVPPMVVQLARSGNVARRYDLRSLREVICSGAPIGREHMQRFVACFPGVTLSQCYGLTETCGPITVCDGVKAWFHTSIGRLIPNMEAKVADVRTGRALPPNKVGELLVRGPPVMRGYLNNKEATNIAIDKDGWLHTGDLCRIDARGLVYVVDRIKELIKYKAYQVPPAELEEMLFTHPDIHDVAVIPYPNEEAGEIPMACVVKKEGSTLKEDDIMSYMENKVAPYKKVRKIVFVEVIPRSASGKTLRRLIKASVMQLLLQTPEAAAAASPSARL